MKKRTKAVTIGINYFGTANQLAGCINDSNAMKANFIKFGYPADKILQLTDDQPLNSPLYPTKANILRAMHWLTIDDTVDDFMSQRLIGKDLPENSKIFFHFSGHGTQEYDSDNDEADGKDESLCPVDYDDAGMIIDDTIVTVLCAQLHATVELHALVDSCHSGTIMDLAWSTSNMFNKLASNKTKISVIAKVVCFSGCHDSQTSADVWSNTGAFGAMTNAFTKVLARNRGQGTFFQIIMDMQKLILAERSSQNASLSCSHQIKFVEDIYEI